MAPQLRILSNVIEVIPNMSLNIFYFFLYCDINLLYKYCNFSAFKKYKRWCNRSFIWCYV